mmetsp:Transcript_115383/g.200246  ORF Transcript_115383/g.200246 Transcript_115383/m.200246 type:complete len:329 (+) Transcript_115383:353-1339(+)
MLKLGIELVSLLAPARKLLLQHLMLKLHAMQHRLRLLDLRFHICKLLLVLSVHGQLLHQHLDIRKCALQGLLQLLVLLLEIEHLFRFAILPLFDLVVLLFQPLDEVKVGVGDISIIDLDLLKVLLIFLHYLLLGCSLCLLYLLDLLASLLLHFVPNGLHAQLVFLLHVPGSPVKLLPQLQDFLVLLQLQHPDEILLRRFILFFFYRQGSLVLLDLGLCHSVVVFLQLEGHFCICLQLYDFILLVVSQMFQPLLKHLQLDLLPLFQILVLAFLVPQVGLFLSERLLLHDPKVIDLLALHEELMEVFLLSLTALAEITSLDLILPLSLLL